MSDIPRIQRTRQGYNQLVRGVVSVGEDRARLSTVIFSNQEWDAVTDAVLEQYNLLTFQRARRDRGPIYEEVERATQTIYELEKELTYASGMGDDEDEVDDPPPLAAHGSEWVSPEVAS
jgi:hypothetical protein